MKKKLEIVNLSHNDQERQAISSFASLMQAIRKEISENIAKTQNCFREIEFSVSVCNGKARLVCVETANGPWVEAKSDSYMDQYIKNKNRPKPLSVCQPDLLTSRAEPIVKKFIEKNLFLPEKTSTISLIIKHGEIAGIRTNAHAQFNRAAGDFY